MSDEEDFVDCQDELDTVVPASPSQSADDKEDDSVKLMIDEIRVSLEDSDDEEGIFKDTLPSVEGNKDEEPKADNESDDAALINEVIRAVAEECLKKCEETDGMETVTSKLSASGQNTTPDQQAGDLDATITTEVQLDMHGTKIGGGGDENLSNGVSAVTESGKGKGDAVTNVLTETAGLEDEPDQETILPTPEESLTEKGTEPGQTPAPLRIEDNDDGSQCSLDSRASSYTPPKVKTNGRKNLQSNDVEAAKLFGNFDYSTVQSVDALYVAQMASWCTREPSSRVRKLTKHFVIEDEPPKLRIKKQKKKAEASDKSKSEPVAKKKVMPLNVVENVPEEESDNDDFL